MSCASRMRACKFATRVVSRPPTPPPTTGLFELATKIKRNPKWPIADYYFFPMYRQTQSRPFRATYCLFLLLDINQSKNRKKGGRDVIRSEGDQGLLLLSHALPLIITVIITPIGWMSRREKKKTNFFFFRCAGIDPASLSLCVCVCFKSPTNFHWRSRGFFIFLNPWIYLGHLSRTLQVSILLFGIDPIPFVFVNDRVAAVALLLMGGG